MRNLPQRALSPCGRFAFLLTLQFKPTRKVEISPEIKSRRGFDEFSPRQVCGVKFCKAKNQDPAYVPQANTSRAPGSWVVLRLRKQVKLKSLKTRQICP